jgi:hypothetical protein
VLRHEVAGHIFLLDDEDVWVIQRGNLHARLGGRGRKYGYSPYLYYRAGGAGQPEYSIARELLQLPHGDRTVQADHINRDSRDNRRGNLRAVSPRENAMNRTLTKVRG